jgi:hypothetical protein
VRTASHRARRLNVTDDMRSAAPEPDPDYVDTFEAASLDGMERFAEQWARETLV